MAEQRKSFNESAIQRVIYRIGMNTYQRKLVESAIIILSRRLGLIGPRDVDNVLRHLEAAYLISSSHRRDILNNMFESEK
ncbi:hypothetical protein COY25_00955 [Candidatus Uhrbacteria bacterium CG_4_10_14_0_2_um_filter_41_7]|uniref:Uncharacterized protein n=1 Tax=Candidatus Uhrbacteria bacterium CG_4_9_14_3_um_filter_41_35 TaxID=1975034 RepID=A0A2M7XG24_9BACT|nr:MAG: hypothetical protein COV92_03950 [Candidatus Uhrbacteria bacterium CG11_big_fil_rev_8_21_14_0_20_41_9]PIZ55476.1 MAG: hypothetical protein COY25_00955 [Candidatus Uhrbacteria bacterium CG_4_10_14_0_2_um_filter_41_7]PJA46824.1 MAG: hypothetical protein CO173_01210 [Candidatus Uhrbacteria bacterium CG_4_9_14_3_um_filter_41_35]